MLSTNTPMSRVHPRAGLRAIGWRRAAAAPHRPIAVVAMATSTAEAAAERLLDLRTDVAVSEEQMEAAIAEVEGLAAAAGINLIFQELNEGVFVGHTLTGQTRKRLSGPVALGTLSFGMYSPADLKVVPTGGTVTKGPAFGRKQGYVITTHFEIPKGDGRGVLRGRSHAIGRFSFAPDNPRRLQVAFEGMRLEPAEGAPAEEVAAWRALLAQHNPAMQGDGVLEVDLPGPLPGWQDYLLMTERMQLVRGNQGSATLLVPVE